MKNLCRGFDIFLPLMEGNFHTLDYALTTPLPEARQTLGFLIRGFWLCRSSMKLLILCIPILVWNNKQRQKYDCHIFCWLA